MANRIMVGDLEVIAVSDGSIAFPATGYFQGTTAEQWEPHKRWLDHDGNIVFPFGCFLVRSGDRRVLIDTGVGPVSTGPFKGGALIGELEAAGVGAEEVDAVFVTHLHLDHCGTVALGRDDEIRPAFPNAKYHWTSEEHRYWTEQPDSFVMKRGIAGAVAGRFEAKDGGASLAPGVTVVAMPGHTPGHAAVVLSSGDARAFLLGDGIGCPAQLSEPEWSGMGDVDPKLARRSQEALAREMEGGHALAGASHFPDLQFGRVLMGEGRRYWQPV